jgi:parvulin-like peptidyl-prolyl isomerase
MLSKIKWTGLTLAFAALAGCGSTSGPRAVGPEDFYRHNTVGEAPLSSTDRPGAVRERGTQNEPEPAPSASVGHSEHISSAVRDLIGPATLPSSAQGQGAQPEPATMPAGSLALGQTTQPAALPDGSATTQPVFDNGQYMTLGALIADVNGTPIYANKLLQLDGLRLRNMARQYDEKQFEIGARDLLERAVNELIYDELEVAAAQKELDAKDKDFAKALTTRWNIRQVTEAGGSIELAKRKFLAEGRTFEEAENDQYRSFLQQLYYVRKVEPRIEVSAADERRYYETHLDTEFSSQDKAYIRMIFCNPALHAPDGDAVTSQMEDSAKAKLEDIRAKAIGGADFTALASDAATNDYRPDTGGFVEIARNGFALTNVEQAVWKLNTNEISPVVKDKNGFYLVKLLNKEAGGVRPFDDVTVQDEIHDKLFKQQLFNLRQAENNKLLAAAVIRRSSFDSVVEMAMQNYPRWSKGK